MLVTGYWLGGRAKAPVSSQWGERTASKMKQNTQSTSTQCLPPFAPRCDFFFPHLALVETMEKYEIGGEEELVELKMNKLLEEKIKKRGSEEATEVEKGEEKDPGEKESGNSPGAPAHSQNLLIDPFVDVQPESQMQHQSQNQNYNQVDEIDVEMTDA